MIYKYIHIEDIACSSINKWDQSKKSTYQLFNPARIYFQNLFNNKIIIFQTN